MFSEGFSTLPCSCHSRIVSFFALPEGAESPFEMFRNRIQSCSGSELPLDDRSLGAFMLARCASDDVPKKYFQIIDEFFKSAKKGCSNDCILEIIKRSGMSNKKIDFCLKNKELMRNIRKNIDITYNNFGASGASTIFINGRKVEGRYKIDKYRRIIEDELERAKSEEKLSYSGMMSDTLAGRGFHPLPERFRKGFQPFRIHAAALS